MAQRSGFRSALATIAAIGLLVAPVALANHYILCGRDKCDEAPAPPADDPGNARLDTHVVMVPVPLAPSASDEVWIAVSADHGRAIAIRETTGRRLHATWKPMGNSISGLLLGQLEPGWYTVYYYEGDWWPTYDDEPKEVMRFAVTDKGPVAAVEFYNAGLDHYFVTVDPAEIASLDSGATPGWKRTGESFHVFAPDAIPSFAVPVCRYYGLPAAGLDTHFFSADAHECSTLQDRWPGRWTKESDAAFGAVLSMYPFICNPVYRLWNNRSDSNHRYTASRATADAMVAKGWVFEGAYRQGPYEDADAFCSAD